MAAGLVFEAGPQVDRRQFGYIVGVGYRLAGGPNGGITRLYDGDAALSRGNRIRNPVFPFQLAFAFPGSQ